MKLGWRIGLVLAVVTSLVMAGTSPANAVVVTIPVSNTPLGVAVDEVNQKVYVAGRTPNAVTVIDAGSQAVTGTIFVGANPLIIAVNQSAQKIYVSLDTPTNNFVVIDAATQTVTNTLTLNSHGSAGIAIAPAANKIYVTNNATSGIVTVINAATETVITTIAVSAIPVLIAVDQTLGKAYVAGHDVSGILGHVDVIDIASDTVLTTIPLAHNPVGIAVDEATQNVYVSQFVNPGSVQVIDAHTDTVINSLPINGAPTGIAIDQSRQLIYVASQVTNTVTIINATSQSILSTIPVGQAPFGIAVDQTTHKIYVGNEVSKTVSVIEALTLLSISPNNGPISGGTSVTLTGAGFTGVTQVTFGGVAASNLVVVNDSTITVTTPAFSVGGSVDVTVTSPDGVATLPAGFTFDTPPPPPVPPSPTPPVPVTPANHNAQLAHTGLNVSALELFGLLTLMTGISVLAAAHYRRRYQR